MMVMVVAPVMVVAVMMVVPRRDAHVRDIAVMMSVDMMMPSVMPHLDRLAFSCHRRGRKRGRLAGRDIDAEAKARAEHRQQDEFSQHISSRRALMIEPID